MIVNVLVKMWCILVLCPVLLAAGAQTLSIDSQLGTSIEDCFERIAIGEQLPTSTIYRNVSELTTRECEQICKQDKQCQAYDYGVGAKGNATCDLSNASEQDLKKKDFLLRHPDYDVYVRRIQCEQGPPSPMRPQNDEDQGPAHRPIVRPEVDDPRRPLSDEYPQDLRPFGTSQPDRYRPYKPPYLNQIDRPDDYNQQPNFDRPPSYGFHRPQDIPYRPERPYNSSYADPYDVLQFQDQRPSYPGHWRPDPQYPSYLVDDVPDIYGPKPQRPRPDLPPLRPEKPEFVYINRPNRRPPRPVEEPIGPSYGPQKPLDYPTKPDPYAPIHDPRPPYKPSRPMDYPYKPDNRPIYNYNSQYASGYGQNQYDDNSIYLEIYDPPRPHRPSRPMYGSSQSYGQGYGYGQSSYGSSSYGQNSHYYGGSISQTDNYNRPQDIDQRPQGPNSGYGVQDSYKPEKPYDTPKPVYGPPQDVTQKPGYGSASSSYGSQSSLDQSYSSQSNYGSQKPQDGYQRPSYSVKPSYDSNRPSYGQNQGSQGSYGSQDQGTYGGQHHTSQQSSYGGSESFGSYNRPYSDNRPTYDAPTYGNKPTYDERPSYGNRPIHEKPVFDRPSYGSDSFDNRPSYEKPFDDRPLYGERPLYDNKPSYNRPEDNKPTLARPGYDEKPSYTKPIYNDEPSYDNNRPDGSPGYDSEDTGYKNSGKPKPNKPEGNNRPDGYNKPDGNKPEGYKPDIKPVYEYEVEKPNGPSYIVKPSGEVITSRPVTIGDYGRPGHGREPPVSYKSCFRRVLAGKRALRSFVRKVVPCERLEDCRRECAEERRFHCESFNYRLDPSFRGKGLCEMMTKPIEAFDLRRDFVEDKQYDFYELDRNSLEPYCPETLRGPGMLHSGFLSSKPDRESYQSSWDRNDWPDRGLGDRNRFYDDRNIGYGTRRRYEDPYFVPYQIGLARTDDQDQHTWGAYGGVYGGDTYYKNRIDHHKSISHWGLTDLAPPVYGVRPLGHQDFDYHNLGKKVDRYGYGGWKRGRWNSSGSSWNGLDYGESAYFKPPKPAYYEPSERSNEESDEVIVKDCSSRRRPGMSLGSGSVRRSLFARTVVQCEAACFGEREFKCVSYSYRYSSSHGSDNCFLSERPYRGVELSADSGSDVYAMPEHQGCSVITNKPLVESECFWHVRSGAAVGGGRARAALSVAGLGACEAECIRATGFFCRGFSFRFDSPTIGDDLENCILTSTPPTSLENGRGLRPNSGHELYARGNYGRGCEPALYDDVHLKESGECYLQYDNAAKLIGTAVKGHARVNDEQACGQACTDAPFRCLSFSFNNNSPPDTENCLLSEIRLFDLQRGVDYEHSTDDWLFAFDLFNGQCWRKVHGRSDYDDPVPELPRPLSPPPHSGELYDGPSGTGASGPTGSGPSGPTGYLPAPPAPLPIPSEPYLPGSGPPSGPGYKQYPDRPDPGYPGPGYLPAEPPGYLPKPSGPSGPYRPSGPPSGPRPSGPGYLPTSGTAPGYPTGPFRPSGPPIPAPSGPIGPPYVPSGPQPGRPYPDTAYGPPPGPPGPPVLPRPGEREEPIVASWRHYTVSGFPCRQGSSCAQNNVAGHWACEPEGGEIGSWDYCCAPTHRCGYSEGFHKPWCYVGPSKDQWRPCSEKYYPYHQHNIPHPTQQGHTGEGPRPPLGPPVRPYDRPDHYLPEADRRYWDELYNNGPQAYYDKYGNPLPGYTRVPMAERPYIKYHHNYPSPGSGQWVPVPALQNELDPPVPGGLGVPRYWPVAYLHKGPPPNMTYFRYNQTDHRNYNHIPTTDKHDPKSPPSRHFSNPPSRDSSRDFDRDFRDRNKDYPSDRRDPNRHYDYPRRDHDRDDYSRDPNGAINPGDRRDSNVRDFTDGRRDPNFYYPSDRRDSTSQRGYPDDMRDSSGSRNYPDDRRDASGSRDYPSETRDANTPSDRNYNENRNRDTPSLPPRDRNPGRERPTSLTNNGPDRPTDFGKEIKNHRDEKTRNITNANEDTLNVSAEVTTTTPKVEVVEAIKDAKNDSEVETVKSETEKPNIEKELENLKGIDDKIGDFSKSIEVLDIEDAKKGDKLSDLKTLEAEERQIEAIGRLLAARRGGKLVLEKRSQKDLETKSIALDKDLVDFNFGNKFSTGAIERRGIVQRVTKDEIEKEKNIDKSLEVSETTYVRPPRVLSTTENIRKAIINGKVFYSASVRNQRDLLNNSTRRPKNLRPLEERAPSVIANTSYGKKKVIKTRNVNPVTKVRRVYRRKYNPDEVRRRLLERERNMKEKKE